MTAGSRLPRLCLQPRQPGGPHRELWYHEQGCRSWLVVTRNTVTHEITKVELARDWPKRGRSEMSQSHRIDGGLIDRTRPSVSPSTASRIRAIRATRWPRRCSPTACG
jgi:hypothetical protein